jgi:hypothetical protein
MDAGILQKDGVSLSSGMHIVRNVEEGRALTFPRKKLPTMDKIGELIIMHSFLPDFSVSSGILCGIRSFHRTRHGFCMAYNQVIVMGERH